MATTITVTEPKKDEDFIKLEIMKESKCNPCLEEKAGFLSRMFFYWTGILITAGNQKYLQENDLYDVVTTEKIANTMKLFKKIREQSRTTLGKDMFRLVKWAWIKCIILSVLSNLLQFSGPIVLGKILNFLSDDSIPVWNGYMWASILFGCYLVRNVLFQHGMHEINHISILVNNCLYGSIFNKIMLMSSSSKKYQDAGKVMNLVNVDTNTIYGFTQMMLFLFNAPIMIIVAVVLIILEIGWIGLIGPGMLLIGMVLQNVVQSYAFSYRKQSLTFTDARTKALNEFFSGIKIIKYYAWESVVFDKIQKIRKSEVALLLKQLVLRGMTDVIATTVPILISITVFGIYVSMGNDFNATKAYTVLSLFNLLQLPLRMIGMVMMLLATSQASLKRIDHFQKSEEKTFQEVDVDISLKKGQIFIQDGEFSWDTQNAKKHDEDFKKLLNTQKKKAPPTKADEKLKISLQPTGNTGNDNNLKEKLLNNTSIDNRSLASVRSESSVNTYAILHQINFQAQPGEFIAVVGQVGAGKSSFLNVLLGEMNKVNGKVSLNGRVAYVPQTAWLMNASVRDNILFGLPYDEEKYKKVLQICELEADLSILPGGDQTEIGERGVNLSGGQKQRVSLARAVYDEADIYIIDDCLSALDAHVGRAVFYNVLKGVLKGKTIIFVTHALSYVSEVDRIAVFRNGYLVENAPYDKLMSSEDTEFYRLNIQFQKKSKAQEQEELDDEANLPNLENALSKKKSHRKSKYTLDGKEDPKTKKTEQEKMIKGGLVKVEEKAEGSVPWSVYSAYISSGGGLITALTIFCFLGSQVLIIANNLWLGLWSENSLGEYLTSNDYIYIYAGLSMANALLVFFRALLFGKFAMTTAQSLQSRLLKKLLRSPMWWFDITPNGRILSRTTKDQDSLDSELPFGIQYTITSLLMLVSSLLMTAVITPLFLVFAVIAFAVYVALVKYYVKAAREIKRIELNSRAPLISHFSETCNGIYVIRAFKKEQRFVDKFLEKSDNLNRALQNFQYAGRWIAYYSDVFSTMMIAATAYFGVLSRNFNYMSNPALIGLALSSSLSISTMLSFTIRLLANTESQMSSVQRIINYIEHNPSEKDFDEPKPESPEWPQNGEYDASNLTYRYRPELENVIHGISFKIHQNEKVGVVGRTGSGKSTLTLGLLRILELIEDNENKKGYIKLDNVNIEELGLHVVRKKATIIPQDPTLFTGTIRYNIDPFNEFLDLDIISALKKVHIWEALTTNEEYLKNNGDEEVARLHMQVTDGGSNFSLGQRQLLCMARALIRRPRVLLMDEATASIDEMTDHLIQKMIRTEFLHTTVVTIAHRLNTIIQYDKIMVLDHGRIVEFDSPIKLFDNDDSYFSGLIKEQGKEFEKRMKYLAKHREEILEKGGLSEAELDVIVEEEDKKNI